MWQDISAVFRALQAGESLRDPATWKVRQNAINAIMAILGALVVIAPHVGININGLTNEDMLAIAGGIAAIAGLFNNYITTATTTKIGLPNASDSTSSGGSNGGSETTSVVENTTGDLYKGS